MSAPVILIVGRICAGKTRYARELVARRGGVLLSLDELMLRVLPRELGEEYDAYSARGKAYLYALAVDIARAGVSPVLDFGFWSRDDRRRAQEWFEGAGLRVMWHYVWVSEEDWRRNIAARNAQVAAGAADVYAVDEGLLSKLASRFEEPERREMDVWHENRRGD